MSVKGFFIAQCNIHIVLMTLYEQPGTEVAGFDCSSQN